MNKIAQTSIFIVILVSVLIGVIAVSIVSSQINRQTAYTTITDDQFTMSNTSCVDVTANCISSLTSVENVTGSVTIGSGNYSICNVNAPSTRYDGILVSGDAYVDSNFNGLTLNSTYVEEACDSIQGGITRTIVPYFVILMAVVLLVFVTGYIKG